MDFMRLIRSLEEFLYEVMTWLVFYPRTLVRSALFPLRMQAYARAEMARPEEDRFSDTLSAPLFLLLTLLISHLFELAVRLHPFGDDGTALGRAMASDQNVVMLRSVVFAAFPLMSALEQVRQSGERLDRNTLRGPFFAECYSGAVFALTLGVGGTLVMWPVGDNRIGVALMLGATVWRLAVQTLWLRRLTARSWPWATFAAVRSFLAACALVLVIAVVVRAVT